MTDWLWATLLLTGVATWTIGPLLAIAYVVSRRTVSKINQPTDLENHGT